MLAPFSKRLWIKLGLWGSQARNVFSSSLPIRIRYSLEESNLEEEVAKQRCQLGIFKAFYGKIGIF